MSVDMDNSAVSHMGESYPASTHPKNRRSVPTVSVAGNDPRFYAGCGLDPQTDVITINRISICSPASALFILRTAQNLPHILQVSLWSSSGRRVITDSFGCFRIQEHSQTVHPSQGHGGHLPSCHRYLLHAGFLWQYLPHGLQSWKQ